MAGSSSEDKKQTLALKDGAVLKCSMCEGGEPNTATKGCVTCGCLYCIDCLSVFHPNRGPLSKHKLVNPENYASPLICEHDDPLERYCNDCKKLVCVQCCIQRYTGHTFVDHETGKAGEFQTTERKDPTVEHQKVLLKLHHLMPPDSKEYTEFKYMCESKLCPKQLINSKNVMDLFRVLTTLNLLSVGNYGTLLELLELASPRAFTILEDHVRQFSCTAVTKTYRTGEPGWQSKDNVQPTMKLEIHVHGTPESLMNNPRFQEQMRGMMEVLKDCCGISMKPGSYILSLEIASLEGFLSIWLQYLDLTLVHRISFIFQEFTEGVHIFMCLLMTDMDICTTLVSFGDM